MDEKDKRMTPDEIAFFYECEGRNGHPICPIAEWCMEHRFDPDTCEETWKQYLAEQDSGTI